MELFRVIVSEVQPVLCRDGVTERVRHSSAPMPRIEALAYWAAQAPISRRAGLRTKVVAVPNANFRMGLATAGRRALAVTS